MMLILQNIYYTHPNKEVLFNDLHLYLPAHHKAALIGNNGAGKSTLLQLIAGLLQPSGGSIQTVSSTWYIPQVFGQFNDHTIAQALNINGKLDALQAILRGEVTEANLTALNDDWAIEDRCHQALGYWNMEGVDLTQKMERLSGGQKTKIFLAGIAIHQPALILMDEPSNHLDAESRQLLYGMIKHTSATLLVVSHDKHLLNLLSTMYELSSRGISTYGGNYDFYREQKQVEQHALDQDIKSKEKALRKAKDVERETMERKQKLDARGKKKQEKAGLPTISMKTFKNNAEKSTARIKDVHAENVESLFQELNQLKQELPGTDNMKFGFDHSNLHKGKIIVTAHNINFTYGEQFLWKEPLNLLIASGERIAIKGANGAGKTTLLQLITGKLTPQSGTMQTANIRAVSIDQDYSLIDNTCTVYEQVQQFNTSALQEHELKVRLNRFLFMKDDWHKPCAVLSGGERMRLMLCCLTITNQAPDMIILDEPTNNLDIQNTEILAAAINDYQGTLLVISHDELFLEQIHVEHAIKL